MHKTVVKTKAKTTTICSWQKELCHSNSSFMSSKVSDRTGYFCLFDINFNGLNVWNGGNKKINKFSTQFCFFCMTCILCNDVEQSHLFVVDRSTVVFSVSVWKERKIRNLMFHRQQAINCFTFFSRSIYHPNRSTMSDSTKGKVFIFFCQHVREQKKNRKP